MKKLKVICSAWGQSWPLGTLADDGQQLLFEYSSEAIEKGINLSPYRLKLRSDAYGDFPSHQMRLPGLIADALPDGWGLHLMDRHFAKIGKPTYDISPLDRLAFLGDRAMGSLAFEPVSSEVENSSIDSLSLLSLASEAKKEISGQESEALGQLLMLGGSPHGARPKVLVNYEQQSKQINTLRDGAGEPWLIKFQAKNEHPEVCAIENVYAQLARACGLEMPQTQYFELGTELAAFGIKRFDRHAAMRIPTLSLAGLLDIDFRIPSVNYETFLRATRLITRSEQEVERAFERCVFNVIFHNRDDHAKNFSYRMDENFQWRLSPCYDLTFNEGPGGEHQMDIQGEGRAPGQAHLLQLALTNSLKRSRALEILERMSTVAGSFAAYAKDSPIRAKTLKGIEQKIAQNLLRMI